jgi:hypothetical protein
VRILERRKTWGNLVICNFMARHTKLEGRSSLGEEKEIHWVALKRTICSFFKLNFIGIYSLYRGIHSNNST